MANLKYSAAYTNDPAAGASFYDGSQKISFTRADTDPSKTSAPDAAMTLGQLQNLVVASYASIGFTLGAAGNFNLNVAQVPITIANYDSAQSGFYQQSYGSDIYAVNPTDGTISFNTAGIYQVEYSAGLTGLPGTGAGGTPIVVGEAIGAYLEYQTIDDNGLDQDVDILLQTQLPPAVIAGTLDTSYPMRWNGAYTIDIPSLPGGANPRVSFNLGLAKMELSGLVVSFTVTDCTFTVTRIG